MKSVVLEKKLLPILYGNGHIPYSCNTIANLLLKVSTMIFWL